MVDRGSAVFCAGSPIGVRAVQWDLVFPVDVYILNGQIGHTKGNCSQILVCNIFLNSSNSQKKSHSSGCSSFLSGGSTLVASMFKLFSAPIINLKIMSSWSQFEHCSKSLVRYINSHIWSFISRMYKKLEDVTQIHSYDL